MKPLTKAQRLALKKVHDRIVETKVSNLKFSVEQILATTPVLSQMKDQIRQAVAEATNPPTYRQFRRTAQQGFDCLMVPFAGMWLGIETDGYTHS